MGSDNVRLGRRGFLRLGAVAAGTIATGALTRGTTVATRKTGSKTGSETKKETKNVWRLSTHGRRACGACKAHAANLYFRAPAFAERTRAHVGCNCPVLKQRIAKEDYDGYFPDGAVIYDNRSGPRRF